MTPAGAADVVVIGSGFGGAVAANRLALAGRDVLVLERGPWRDTLPVRSMGIERRAPLPYGMKAFTHFLRSLHVGRHGLTLNKAGLFELASHPGLAVLAASGVGGGSIAWGGLMTEPRDPAYWSGRHPDLDPAQVERYYHKILADMGAVRPTRQQWLPNSVWSHLPVSLEGRCLPADPQPHVAIEFPRAEGEERQVTQGASGVKRERCAFDGDSVLGSRGGAKASVDFVYLAPVLGKGARVRDLCEATLVRGDGAGGYEVHFSDLHAGTRDVVRARQVVLAAGTMNTLRLLFASVGGEGGLASMPRLGKNFGSNGDLIGAWFKASSQPSSFRSPPGLGLFTVAGIESPTFGMAGLPGVDSIPLPSFVKTRLARMVMMFGIGIDSGRASVGFRDGALVVDYDPGAEPLFDEIRAGFRVLASESGQPTRALGRPTTVHPWGGASVGPDAEHGVVDHRGEVYGNPGLFIADASALPAAVGDPPSLAVAAWAHHVADSMPPLRSRCAPAGHANARA